MLLKMRATVLLFAVISMLASAQDAQHDRLLKSAIDAQQRGDYAAAIRDYRKVLELRPGTVEARVNLGAALAHTGQYDAAIAEYKLALPSISQKNAVLLNIALAYYKKGDFKTAREQFESLRSSQPKDVRLVVLLGDTDVHLRDYAAAIDLLTPFEIANPQNLDVEYVLGTAMIGAGKRREGVTRIEMVARTGNSAEAYVLAGTTLMQINEFEQSRRDLEAALQADPKYPGIYTLVGTARDKTGDVKEAESAFREALKQNPNDFNANLYLGAILYKRRDLDQARIYMDQALKLDSSNSMARYEDAMLKSAAKQYEEAAAELEKLVKDDPDWLEPHVELASLYYKLHRPDDGARERQTVEKLTASQQSQGPGKP